MAGFQEHFLKQLRFILGDCHIANIFRMSSIVSDSTNTGGKIAHNDSCSASGHIEVTARRSTIIKMLIQRCCPKGQRYRYAEGVRENALLKKKQF